MKGTVGVYVRSPNKLKLLCVKELEAGVGFGELALINNAPRSASIICHDDCHFATMDKNNFLQILREKEE